MGLTAAVCLLLQKTAKAFHGAQRRRFIAETVEAFGLSQRQAERELGWTRDTIRKAQHELHSGITCADNFSARGRQPTEFHLPHLLQDLRDLVQDNLQTDPTFLTTGLYCRLSAAEVRKQLIERKGYTDQRLPSVQTIGVKLNLLGFRLRTVVKSRPQKK
jgi:transposase